MPGRHFGHFRRLGWPGGRYGRGYPYGYGPGQPYNITVAPNPPVAPPNNTQQTDTLMIVGGMMFALLLVILLLYRNQE